MSLIDNINKILKDDLMSEIKKGAEISVVASCFSIYAFQELKQSLKDIKSFKWGCGQNPGHLNEVIYGIYSPTNYCSIKTV